jgi:hypothetical protein
MHTYINSLGVLTDARVPLRGIHTKRHVLQVFG